MSFANNVDDNFLGGLLELISVQLDGTTGIVKIPAWMHRNLDVEGQITAASFAGSILGHPVEFYVDSANVNRIYLASLADIQATRPCEAQVVPGFALPMLVPPLFQPPEQPNHLPRVDAPQPNFAQPPEAPQEPSPLRPALTKERRQVKTPDDFTAFRAHHFPLVKQANPGRSKKDITDIIRDKWAGMSDEERRPYSRLAGNRRSRRPPARPAPGHSDQSQRPDSQQLLLPLGSRPVPDPAAQAPAYELGALEQGQDTNGPP